jgi:hypothetical protein
VPARRHHPLHGDLAQPLQPDARRREQVRVALEQRPGTAAADRDDPGLLRAVVDDLAAEEDRGHLVVLGPRLARSLRRGVDVLTGADLVVDGHQLAAEHATAAVDLVERRLEVAPGVARVLAAAPIAALAAAQSPQ